MTLSSGFMQHALTLAANGTYTTHPNPRVGCVVVNNGEIVGEGWHEHAGEPHAEVFALRQAGERAHGADVYVTLEPCAHHGRTPPCVEALIAAGVRKVHVAIHDPFDQVSGRGVRMLREAGIEVEAGLMEAEARTINRGFLSRIERGRPWITLKFAMSLDGRTAMASGESRWITGQESRDDVHRLRAAAGAVLTTSATVLEDDPQLTVRLPGEWRQPDRIIIDSRDRVPRTAKVWAEGARRFALVASENAVPRLDGVEVIGLETGLNGSISLPAAMRALAAREVNEVMVECGSPLAGALLDGRLVDELVIYAAPKLLGEGARPLAVLPGLDKLEDHVGLEFTSVERLGDDLKITARVRNRER